MTPSSPGDWFRLAEALVSFAAPGSLEADQYRTLRHAIERLHRDSGFRVFGVTSPCAGDGKTITALNLAGSIAQSPQARVLVIDADLHRPSVAQYLGLAHPNTRGLADILRYEEYCLPQTVRLLDSLKISVLLPGRVDTGPYELLASSRLDQLLAEARRRFDYILVDTPPVVPVADCRVLSRVVDGFILVVTAHKTPRKLLAEALTLLDPAKVLGVVFNGDDRPLSVYYGYYGYHAKPSRARVHRTSWLRRVLGLRE